MTTNGNELNSKARKGKRHSMVKLKSKNGKHLIGGRVELFRVKEKKGGHVVVGKTTGVNAHLFLSKSCSKKRKDLLDDVYMRTLLWGARQKKWVGKFRFTADIKHHHKKTFTRLVGNGTFVEAKESGTYRLSCGAELKWPLEMKTCGRPLPKTSRTLRFWLEPGKTFIVLSWVTKKPVTKKSVTKKPSWEETCFSLMERENRAISEWNWNGIDEL